MWRFPTRPETAFIGVMLAVASGCGESVDAADPAPPTAAPVVAPPPMESPPIALADTPPRGSWERTGQGGSPVEDVFSGSDGRLQALLDAMVQSASGSMADVKGLKERAAARGGAVALCRLPDAAGSGPLTVVRFDPPATGFGLQDDAAIADGVLFLVVPDTAGTAVLQRPEVGGAPLNVAWGASESGRSTCRIVD